MKSLKEKEKDRREKEIVAELDYLLKEGFLCLKNTKEPIIVLNPGVSI